MKIPLNWLKEIVSLPKDTKDLTDKLTMVGHMLDKKLEVKGETVLDLELRGNRADCYSILGIAREVQAIFGSKVKSLETERLIKVNRLKNSSLKVETPLVKRAATTEVYDVKITDSPDWLKNKIASYGMESVNNIVDLTNYVMIETGEPMHAFDLDKVRGELQIRLAKNKERMTTFQDSIVTLTKEDLVWAKGDSVLSVARAIGEKHNSISSSSKNILVEAANYDRANSRKSVYRHNLLTEAGIRHEKDLDPNMVEPALGRFLHFIKKYKWGNFDATFYDYYPKKVMPWKIKLALSQLENLGGVKIENSEIKKIVTILNFKIIKIDKTNLEVEVPTYRTDVVLEEDLIEEILRIYGYDKIPTRVLSLEIPNQITPNYIIQENNLRLVAAAVGVTEAIGLSFVKEERASYNVHPLKAEAGVVSLINPPSPDNKNFRISFLPNLKEVAQKAIYERVTEVALFEIGKIYYKYKNDYKEERKIGFVYYSEEGNEFVNFKGLLDSFFIKAGISNINLVPEVLLSPLLNSFEILVGGKNIGYGGKTGNNYFAEIDLDGILGLQTKDQGHLLPQYPPQIEDVTITFPEKTLIGDVMQTATNLDARVSTIELKDTFKDAYTFRIWYQDLNKTLTDSEVEQIRNKILAKIKENFGGQIKS